jgi:hypothetical protein
LAGVNSDFTSISFQFSGQPQKRSSTGLGPVHQAFDATTDTHFSNRHLMVTTTLPGPQNTANER